MGQPERTRGGDASAAGTSNFGDFPQAWRSHVVRSETFETDYRMRDTNYSVIATLASSATAQTPSRTSRLNWGDSTGGG